MERMSSRPRKGVTVVPILRKHLHSLRHTKMSSRITPVSQSSSNEYKPTYSAEDEYKRKNEYDLVNYNNLTSF